MKTQPIVFLALSFIVGIILQDYIQFKFYYVLGCVAVFVITFILLHYFAKRKLKEFAALFLFAGLGVVFPYFQTQSYSKYNLSQSEEFVFRVSKKLNSNAKSKRYEIFINEEKKTIPAVLYMPKEQSELDFLHYYKAKLFVKKVEPPLYDFQFNYSKYLERKGIFYAAYLNETSQQAKIRDVSIVGYFKQKRLEVLQKINKSGLSKNTEEFLKGIILADRTEMNDGVVQDFNRTGLTHFLAISGTHVVVIYWIIHFLLIKLIPSRFQKLAIFLSLIFIWFFAFFIGWGSSVVRSCLMLTMYYAFILLDRKPDLLHSLSLSALLILIFDTQQIFDVGFQLSFIAVLGIHWLSKPIENLFPFYKFKISRIFVEVLSMTLAAQIVTLPIILYYFHQFSLISILANVFIVPFSEFVIIFSFGMTILYAADFSVHFLEIMYDYMVSFLLKAIHWFAGFDAVFMKNISLNLVEIVLLFLSIYFLKFFIVKRTYKHFIKFILVFMMFFIARLSFNIYENSQSASIVLKNKNNNVLLIREGRNVHFWMKKPDENTEKFLISPYIVKYRISNYSIKILPNDTKSVTYKGKSIALE